MSAERRRIIAVLAALAVFAAAGIFWLTRLVFAATAEAHFEAGFGGPSPSASVPSVTPAPLRPRDQALPDDPAPTQREAVTTRTRRPVVTRTPSTPVTTSPSAEPPVPKTRTVQVSGVALDNRNPRTMCTEFHNTVGIPLTLNDISVSGDLKIDPIKCAGQADVKGTPCADGKPLGADQFCFVGVVPTVDVPDKHKGTVSMTVAGLCTSTKIAACQGLGEPPPSPLQRVLITWIAKSDTEICHTVSEPDDPAPIDSC